MDQLRLGRVPDPLDNEQDDDELGLFKSNTRAYREDVAPRARGAEPLATPVSAPAPKGSTFKFDLYGSNEAAVAPAPKKEGSFKFDLYGNEPEPEAPKPKTSQGDTSRGFSAALGQTPALLKGAVGFAGAVGEKTFGEGGAFSALKQYGLEGYKKGMGEIEARAKDTDDVTVAWDKAKKGDLGALVDWVQYGVGYLGGNIVETVGTSILGGAVGGALSGPAAPVGAAAGVVAGAAGKEAVKGVAKGLVESMVAKEAAKLAEKAGVQAASEEMVKQATKTAAKGIGATTALAASGIIKETGGIYGEAEEEASSKGRELDGGDLARVFGAGVVAGLSEAAVDKLGLSAAAGKIKIPGGGRAGRSLVGGAAGVGIEGGQELFQTAIERFGAAKELTGEDAKRDYINSFALGGLGGGAVGGVTGAFRSGESKPVPTAERVLDEAKTEEKNNSAGFVPEPAEQVQAQLDAVKEGRKPAAVLGAEEASNVSAGGLFRAEIVDPETGSKSILFSKDAETGARAQDRVKEIGFKQAMGEVLGLVDPTATTVENPNNVVVQQRDDQSGQIITEQAVSPDRVNEIAPIPGTTASVTDVNTAKAERTSEIDAAAQQAATSTQNDLPQPTEAQKAAGNYKKGQIKLMGLDISIENPSGSERNGTDASGKAWKTEMKHHYGYVKGSKGNDKDQVDVFVGPNPDSGKVFVVDQIDPATGKFDEHKAMLGFDTIEEAEAGYRANYDANWQGMGAISEMPADAFKSWVKDGTKKKPLALKVEEKAAPVVTETKAAPAVTETKPETKTKKKTQAKLEPKPETKKEAKPEPKPETKTEKKPEPKKTVEQKLKDKVKEQKQQKEQKASQTQEELSTEQEAVELWEDNDDGKVPHIPFFKLSREMQKDWIAAFAPADGEKPYASADLHDKMVESALRNARTERSNKKAAENRKAVDGDSMFRTSSAGNGLTVDKVVEIFDAVTKGWVKTPDVLIVQSEQELPAEIRDEIAKQDISGKVPGVYNGGKVYLVADNLNNKLDVLLTVAHEITGHFGLRQILGGSYTKVMNDIYRGNALVKAKADEMMVKEGLSRVVAVEEVLADMAEQGVTAENRSALQKIFAAIRKWLRENLNISVVTDSDLKQIVANARRYVIEGDVQAGIGEAATQNAFDAGVATFYSPLERGVRGLKQETAPANQWMATIKNLPGIKAEELEWTGLEEWLSLQQGKVTKQQLLDFIGGNRVKFNEVILTNGKGSMEDWQLAELVQEIGEDPGGMRRDQMLDLVSEHFGWKRKTLGEARHKQYTLDGGTDYTELVLTDPTIQPYKVTDRIHFGDLSAGKAIGWLRMNIRKDKDGNDVLFLEELQSQRGQDGRDVGFGDADGQVPDAPFVKDTRAWTALLVKRAIAYAQAKGIDRIAWTTGEQQVDRYKLSKQIDNVTAKKNDNGTYSMGITMKDGSLLPKTGVREDELAGVVGADLAKEIIAKAEDGKRVNFAGLDLDVGGDGVRNYYNSTVPSVVKELIGKKVYGQGKVEVMQIEGGGDQLGFVIPAKMQELVAQDGLPLFRRKDYEAQYADLDPKTRAMALEKGHYTPPTIKERLEALKPNLWLRIVQGTFDRYRSVRDISLKAYMALRMSSATDGAVEGLLHYGQVFDDDGALNLKKGTKGLLEVLAPVGGEVDRFLLWIAANRAGELKGQDRERFFSDAEIAALKKLNAGTLPDGKSRYAVYSATLREMNELNRSVLDVARSAGLIDDTAYKKFSSDIWYVPFYRQMDEDGSLGGAQNSSGAVGQYLSKKLKGSERQLNDLMQNVLMNWSHILSASMKNKAAVLTLNDAVKMGGVVTRLNAQEKGAVKVMEKGKEVFYRIDDEFLLASLDAVASMPSYGMWTTMAREFKTTLTRFISLSPTFKINNLIRDSVQSIGLSELEKNPITNVMQGWRAYKDQRAEALIGGGLFSLGNAFDGDQAASVKRLLKNGVAKANVLTTTEQAQAWFKKAQDKYDEVSDAAENANRIALYQQLRSKGATHLEAAYAARDLQDFGLQGSWAAIRYASQILPYFNARLQGMYKLGRDGIAPSIATLMGNANESERQKAVKFGTVLGAVVTTGLILYLSQKDDDDWKKREDWDRDGFFWFKIPGTEMAVRIPKPFEMGAVSTIVERFTEQMVDEDVEGKVFGKRLLSVLHDNLAINPIPQIVRPLYDIARNKDGFTDRPIESMGAERLSPENRINPGTSAAALTLGKANSLFADFVSAATGGTVSANDVKVSPIQYDYLIRGYLGWVGTVIQTTSNLAAQPFKEGESPDRKVDDFLVVGNFVKSMPQNQSRYVSSFYENSKAIATATADYRSFIAAGDAEKAAEVLESKRDLIALSKLYSKVQDNMSTLNKRIKQVEADKDMAGAEKRIEMDRLAQLRIEWAKRAEEIRIARTKEK
jgi:outer membrane biosynthesis protein TonB